MVFRGFLVRTSYTAADTLTAASGHKNVQICTEGAGESWGNYWIFRLHDIVLRTEKSMRIKDNYVFMMKAALLLQKGQSGYVPRPQGGLVVSEECQASS